MKFYFEFNLTSSPSTSKYVHFWFMLVRMSFGIPKNIVTHIMNFWNVSHPTYAWSHQFSIKFLTLCYEIRKSSRSTKVCSILGFAVWNATAIFRYVSCKRIDDYHNPSQGGGKAHQEKHKYLVSIKWYYIIDGWLILEWQKSSAEYV